MSSPIKRGPKDQLAANLKARREAARLSLAEVGVAIGVTKAAVYAWEQGSAPTNDKLDRLAALYGTTVQELRFGPAVREAPATPYRPHSSLAAHIRLRIAEIIRELIEADVRHEDVVLARELLESSEMARFLTGGEKADFDEEKAMRFLDGLREVIRSNLRASGYQLSA